MSVTYRPFVPDIRHQSFVDSQALMAANFSDASGTSLAFLAWLYLENPFGKAIGFIAYDGETPVSQLFLTFQQASFEGRLFTVAVASNACTASSHRNQGHFYKLFTLLIEAAREMKVPFIWAYPNPNSLRGFKKVGFQIVKDCSLELVPVSYWGIWRELKNKKQFSVDSHTEDVLVDLGSLSRFTSSRSDVEASLLKSQALDASASVWRVPLTMEQLRWRYLGHPTRRYHALMNKESGAVAVLRFIRLFGLNTGLIMKSNAATPAAYNSLLADLKSELRGKISFLTTLPSELSNPGLRNLFRERFLIPHQLSPRRFPLAVYPIQESLPLDSAHRFDFVLGDYEAL